MTSNPIMTHSSDYSALKTLAEEFWTWRAEHMPISYDDIPRMERPANWIPDWTAAKVSQRRDELSAFTNELSSIDPSTWPITQQVDYQLTASALARVHWELNITRSHKVNPDFYVHQTLGAIFLLLLNPSSFDRDRCKEIITRLRSIPTIVEVAKQNLKQTAVRPFAVAAIEKLANVRQCLSTVATELNAVFDPAHVNELKPATDEAIVVLESFREWLETELPNMEINTAVGRKSYCYFLKHVALMPCTPEQLFVMSRQEWERSVAFESFERTRNEGVPVFPVFGSQAAQIEREAQLENDIRRFLETKNILTIPARSEERRVGKEYRCRSA